MGGGWLVDNELLWEEPLLVIVHFSSILINREIPESDIAQFYCFFGAAFAFWKKKYNKQNHFLSESVYDKKVTFQSKERIINIFKA